MITFKFRGTIYSIGEFKEGTRKDGTTWCRVDVVCDVPDGRYTDKVVFTASDANADIISNCEVGEEIAVEGYIYAREWNEKFYNNLQASTVYVHGAQAQAAQPAATPANNDDNDLPF